MNPRIFCFGEILWDVLPTSRQAGGAPMNVAVHLRNFGLDSQLISRVGSDELGQELLDFLAEKHVPITYVQQGVTHLTGIAKANLTDRNEVVYKIVQPVAWDYIMYDDALTPQLADAMLVYGSLVARSETSRETLLRLLDQTKVNVFDVNLRAPHYTKEIALELLEKAHILKINHNELEELLGWLGVNLSGKEALQYLFDTYALQSVCLTRGENGAALLTKDGYVEHPGFVVNVEDTIGSGDSFLAAFLYKTLRNERPEKILEFACATGSYVATQHGATPSLTAEFIENRIHHPELT